MKDAPAKSGSSCSRKCCWSPQGVCAKHRNCPCHRSKTVTDRDAEMVSLEQARLDKARNSSETLRLFTGMGIDPWKR